MRIAELVTLLSVAVPSGYAARILAYFPPAGQSHHYFFQPFLVELAKRGHQIDYISPTPLEIPHPNITLHSIEYTSLEIIGPSCFHQWRLPVLEQLSNILEYAEDAGKKLCKAPTIRKLLASNVKYDLIIQEEILNYESGSAFKHKFNVPSVSLLTSGDLFQTAELTGLTINPSFMVHELTKYTDRMGLVERIHNTYLWVATLYLYYSYLRRVQKTMDECYTYPGWESRPPITQLLSDQALILVNSHPSVGFAFPMAPHVKEIGGAVVAPRKPLPKDIEAFINKSEHGVIYFSLGSVVSLDAQVLAYSDTFLKVFSRRKERVLFKWDFQPWNSTPANIMVSKWFPQQDILAHKNTKLFITHAGAQSSFEAVHFGVPIIAIPSFADQPKNALALVQRGYGVSLNWNNVTEESLTWALKEVLEFPRYKQQVLEGSAALRDRRMSPVEEGVYWIEYVLRHGDVLRPQGSRMSFIKLHCVDIFVVFFLTCLFIFYFVKMVLFWLRRRESNAKA